MFFFRNLTKIARKNPFKSSRKAHYNKPDPSLEGCPSHYPPTKPLFPHSSKPSDNSNLQAISSGCNNYT